MTHYRYQQFGILALVGLTALVGCKKDKETKDTGPQTMVIGTENIVIASKGTVTTGPTISGTLTPELQATIRAQVSGSVLATSAEVGQTVSRGQSLGRLDASALQESYLSAKSGVASAQATLDLATRDLQRQQTLLKAGAVSQRDLETAQRTSTSSQAQVEAARAQLASASKNLDNTRILAPFNGIVSQAQCQRG